MSFPILGQIIQGVAAVGSIISGAAQAQSNERAARRIAALETERSQQQAKREAQVTQEKERRLRAQQQASFLGAGVERGVGSPLLLEVESLRIAREELNDIFTTAGFEQKKSAITAQQRIQNARARGRSAVFGGLGTLGSLAVSVSRNK